MNGLINKRRKSNATRIRLRINMSSVSLVIFAANVAFEETASLLENKSSKSTSISFCGDPRCDKLLESPLLGDSENEIDGACRLINGGKAEC